MQLSTIWQRQLMAAAEFDLFISQIKSPADFNPAGRSIIYYIIESGLASRVHFTLKQLQNAGNSQLTCFDSAASIKANHDRFQSILSASKNEMRVIDDYTHCVKTFWRV